MIKFYQKHCEKYYAAYGKLRAFFLKSKRRQTALEIFGKVSAAAVYAAYIYLIIFLALSGDVRIFRAIIVPAAVFFAATAVRSAINAPRPYEKFPLKPLVHKSTKGRSCPSRHSACAFGVAFACMYISVPAGIVMMIAALLISVSRPIMGVHFPLDVIFGAFLAAAISIAGFYIV